MTKQTPGQDDSHGESDEETEAETGIKGIYVVGFLYATIVFIAGFFGFLLGIAGPENLNPPEYLGIVKFPPTPLGLAVFGVLTIGTGLGFFILLIV
ncbi:MAG: hypothetical protein SXQ77_12160, partial [Halobacteria archaeon]|nr:hypothetical protein [Halobacteria archaeon]